MQLASGSQIPDGLLAAIALRNENSRLGVPRKNPALHLGHDGCKSEIVLGLKAADSTTRIRSRSTGKERDTESGLDYFGARYYASNVGRWISADWAQKPEAVPYSKLDDPQSLNLYEYMRNNPLGGIDPDGHQQSLAIPLLGGGAIAAPEVVIPAVVGGAIGAALVKTGEWLWDHRVGIGDGIAANGSIASNGWDVGQYQNVLKGSGQATQSGNQQQQSSQQASTLSQPPEDERDKYVNPGHHDTSSPNYVSGKTPLPSDAESVYAGAIKDTNRAPGTSTTYYGKSADGKYYRYQGQNGEVHWNGTVNRVPKPIKNQLDGK